MGVGKYSEKSSKNDTLSITYSLEMGNKRSVNFKRTQSFNDSYSKSGNEHSVLKFKLCQMSSILDNLDQICTVKDINSFNKQWNVKLNGTIKGHDLVSQVNLKHSILSTRGITRYFNLNYFLAGFYYKIPVVMYILFLNITQYTYLTLVGKSVTTLEPAIKS